MCLHGFYLKNPGDFSHVVEELRKIPEVVECHFTTGQYDMFIKLFARNNQHLLEIIHTKLQPGRFISHRDVDFVSEKFLDVSFLSKR